LRQEAFLLNAQEAKIQFIGTKRAINDLIFAKGGRGIYLKYKQKV